MINYAAPLITAAKISPQSTCQEIFNRLDETEPAIDPRDLQADVLEIRTWPEIRAIERRVAQLGAKVGMHPKPQQHNGKNVSISYSIFSPFTQTKIRIPLPNAISYAIQPEASQERLGISPAALTKLQNKTDFEILEKLIYQHFHIPKLLSKSASALGGGLLLLTLVSPQQILGIAATIGIVSGPIVPAVLGIATLALIIGLVSYGAIRYSSSLYTAKQAAFSLSRMEGRSLREACNIGIEYYQNQKEKNQKLGNGSWLSTALKPLLYTRSGDMRWYTHWESSLDARINSLRLLQARP